MKTDQLITQEFSLNMGPQHPSTHGVYRVILTLNGETITRAENVIGYLHRGIEKLAESRTYPQIVPYTDRLDYLAGVLNNIAYTQTVEKHMNIILPERAEYLRVIFGELSRIASHLVCVSSMALDLNSFTGWMYAFADREKILDLFEMTFGGRLTTNYARIGGVSKDIPDNFLNALQTFLHDFKGRLRDFNTLVSYNQIFIDRTKNVGKITAKQALDFGFTGPNLRASGVNFDLRKKAPYSIYDRFDFDIPVLQTGDCYDRYMIRILEIEQSVRIIEQAMKSIPDGPILAEVPRVIKPEPGETFHQIEGAKGLLGFHMVSDGSKSPYRLHIHGPSFVNIGIIPEIGKGMIIQDFVAFLASLDFVLGEVDR
jgi:NADH-quinone oxidoreductase subunit D